MGKKENESLDCNIYVIKKTQDIEQEESPHVICGPSSLYVVDEGGDSIDCHVVRTGAKLSHWEKVGSFNVVVDAFGYNLF